MAQGSERFEELKRELEQKARTFEGRIDECWREHPDQIRRHQSDQEPAAAAVDVDAIEIGDGSLEKHAASASVCRTATCLPPDSRCAFAPRPARMATPPCGPIWRARFLVDTSLSPCISTIMRLFAIVFHHQRLDHGMLGHAKLARRHGRATAFFVPNSMLGERHAGRCRSGSESPVWPTREDSIGCAHANTLLGLSHR